MALSFTKNREFKIFFCFPAKLYIRSPRRKTRLPRESHVAFTLLSQAVAVQHLSLPYGLSSHLHTEAKRTVQNNQYALQVSGRQ